MAFDRDDGRNHSYDSIQKFIIYEDSIWYRYKKVKAVSFFKKKYWGCVVDHGESQLSFYLYAKKISRGPYLYLDLSEYKSVSDRSKRTFPDHNVSFFELISRWNNPDELFAAETDYLRSGWMKIFEESLSKAYIRPIYDSAKTDVPSILTNNCISRDSRRKVFETNAGSLETSSSESLPQVSSPTGQNTQSDDGYSSMGQNHRMSVRSTPENMISYERNNNRTNSEGLLCTQSATNLQTNIFSDKLLISGHYEPFNAMQSVYGTQNASSQNRTPFGIGAIVKADTVNRELQEELKNRLRKQSDVDQETLYDNDVIYNDNNGWDRALTSINKCGVYMVSKKSSPGENSYWSLRVYIGQNKPITCWNLYQEDNNPENSKRYSLNVHLEPSFSTKAELCAYYMKTDLPKGNAPENYIKRLQQPFTRNIVN